TRSARTRKSFDKRIPLLEGLRMEHQHIAVRHSHNVIVERPGVDGLLRLLHQQRPAARPQLMLCRHNMRSFHRLSRYKALALRLGKRRPPIDEHLNPTLAMRGREPTMIGSPLVAECRKRYSRVDDKLPLIRKDRTHHTRRRFGLDRPMEMRRQRRRREMHAP